MKLISSWGKFQWAALAEASSLPWTAPIDRAPAFLLAGKLELVNWSLRLHLLKETMGFLSL